ncbi:aminotransferase class IV [Halovivax limisalsi]|uniref:aminotransferase class IV n=1 Tax=Halovivax limisalsi TaxID=1453760 RepID=UPI001FFD3597|nr:aminotransferase class IV [Halovivax limisalsi]
MNDSSDGETRDTASGGDDATDADSNDADPIYWVDGDLVPAGEAVVSVDDRGFRYGDAAFETMRAYGGSLFRWDAHADRLAETCDLLSLDHGLDRETLRERIDETLAANGLEDAYVRLSITRGVQPGTLAPDPDVDPTVVVWVKPLPRGGVDGVPVWDGPATVRTVERPRIPDDAIPARAKTHNYLDGILARLDGRTDDAGGSGDSDRIRDPDEVLLYDGDGYLAEGATSNVFVVADGVLYTPATDGPVLPGVTRRTVLDLADDLDVPVEVGRYGSDLLDAADELFLTNTTWEVRPVDRLDGRTIGPGPITSRLRRAFDATVESRHYG